MSCTCGGCGTAVMRIDCEGMCKDGLSAYELWSYSQPADADTSRDAFYKMMTGTQIVSVAVTTEAMTND